MKYCILALFGLVTLSMAAEPVYYELNDFLQAAKRNPNKCVNKVKSGSTTVTIPFDFSE